MGELTPQHLQSRRRVSKIQMRTFRSMPPLTVGVGGVGLTWGNMAPMVVIGVQRQRAANAAARTATADVSLG